ncbi:Six-hairpin glycosidase [Venustampulla echinocandica]|uniref:Six-hairpin glycosidase n=1 Tax=Venustampulla echinocandica TaxID=2656787 RepID=A0A370TWV5_9HELO|nr:Six-hairpin glycosidase [Venustampulla echinocandica]RDL40012.1 Six-hairpin glycosidase [Venustampulla echinocandica]
MSLFEFKPWLLVLGVWVAAATSSIPEGIPKEGDYSRACPDYKRYAVFNHPPFSEGPMGLPFQRPSKYCRTFSSPLVEKVIEDITGRMVNKDLARLFENAFPNTLDTTVRWHVDGTQKHTELKGRGAKDKDSWQGPQSFVVTGDINAEWLRDSTNQLLQYQPLAKKDKKIFNLILGAINTQSEYVIESPYCNAFQPPPASKLAASQNGQEDYVHPAYEPSFVFECKYELDSLAHFLALGNTFHKHTGSLDFLTPRWYKALDTVLEVLDQQSESTFDPKTGRYIRNAYTFNRKTATGTETLSLDGVGNPLNFGTGLIRSAFRPSDDATILGFYIPANAQMAVELKRAADVLRTAKNIKLSQILEKRAQLITDGIWEYGVVEHKKYGRVFAFEVDGWGSQIIMDDANVPSLLALPILGFVDRTDEVYQNTRKMLLEKAGNPYYLEGLAFHGIGGPHVGLEYAWPMSLLLQAMTSDDDKEIMECVKLVLTASRLGLVHESINVNRIMDYTRSWFAWANSVFAQTILDLAQRKPHLIFGPGAEPYIVE